MKTKYLALLIAAMGSSLSFGASIDGLDAAYSKDSTVYDGTSGDELTVSSPTTIGVNNTAHWTMAFTISGLGSTSGSNVGLLFTYNTGSYKNLEGLGFNFRSQEISPCAPEVLLTTEALIPPPGKHKRFPIIPPASL
ncbi:MAG: hypothetical protein LIO47_00965 [Akkermansia sp.]|nr:hypothetical protein [Akkermansia sp.]